MKVPLAVFASVAVCSLTACATPEEVVEADGTWVGTITTEGNVTTVVTESGSVWGGPATLVEEASIGVESGADEYMFGQVPGVWATDDRILVLDAQIKVLRVYDLAGRHLRDIGRSGQGPGEFGSEPLGVAVNAAGDILVVESSTQIEVFAPDGTPKATRNSGASFNVYASDMLVLGTDDSLWVPAIDFENRRFGYSMIGADGNAGEPDYPPELEWESGCLTYTTRGREDDYCGIPFYPTTLSARTREGGWVVGVSDAYSFEVHRADGSLLRVRRSWEPVPVGNEEAAYRKQQTTEYVRGRADGDDWRWNGPDVPDHKPAYVQLVPDRNGRIWALRERESYRSTDCDTDVPECWLPAGYWLEAFAPDGRFLGSVTLDRRPYARPFIDGTTLVAIVIDDAGTIMVKRYRLEP